MCDSVMFKIEVAIYNKLNKKDQKITTQLGELCENEKYFVE